MEPYQERVVAEKADLDDKKEKLKTFLNSPTGESIDTDERQRMWRQFDYMRGYSTALGDRIRVFQEEAL